MSIFKAFKRPPRATKEAFLSTLKYGDDLLSEWNDAKAQFSTGIKRQNEVKKKIESLLGLEGISYPSYLYYHDIFVEKGCPKSPINICVTKRNVGDGVKQTAHCLFCGTMK